MVYYQLPSGGATFSVGSIAWTGALSHDGGHNDVARITRNVLRHFLGEDGPA
jgi:N,N-dimethylformamidase